MCPGFPAAQKKLRAIIILKEVRDELAEHPLYKEVHPLVKLNGEE